MRLLNLTTGEVRPVPCRRLACPTCLRRAAWRRSLAIGHAQPERFITLTQVGNDWPTIRNRVKSMRYQLTREVGSHNWTWNVEKNPRGTGLHVQAWQRGDFVPQADLSRIAVRFGMGEVVDIRRWRTGGEAYALKEAYAVKEAVGAEGFLGRNGGRLTHQSRGFFPGPVREVERAAVAAKLGPSDDTWKLVTLAELHNASRGPQP